MDGPGQLVFICTVLAEHLDTSDDPSHKATAQSIRSCIADAGGDLEQMFARQPRAQDSLDEWRNDLRRALRTFTGPDAATRQGKQR
jgi:hypothetical protein